MRSPRALALAESLSCMGHRRPDAFGNMYLLESMRTRSVALSGEPESVALRSRQRNGNELSSSCVSQRRKPLQTRLLNRHSTATNLRLTGEGTLSTFPVGVRPPVF